MAAEISTLDEWTWSEGPRPAEPRGLSLTVLYHPDPRRIGQTATARLGAGEHLALSRQGPDFAFADTTPAPLDDPYCSRRPLHLAWRRGGLTISASHGRIRYAVDGRPGLGGETLTPAALDRGVRLTLGRRVLIELRSGVAPRQPSVWQGLVCAAHTLGGLRAAIERLARSDQPALILGESGVGKEQVARAVHALGSRAGAPFVAVNMSAIPRSTAAAQLFGHARGAFTGADRASTGFFGQAGEGTLLLDELGEAPPDIQPLLLRALDTGEIQPVGGPPRRTDARVLAATDADLAAMARDGRFRPALWFRLADRTLTVPPLRTRPGDLAMQAVAFAREALAEHGAVDRLDPPAQDAVPWLGLETMQALLDDPWPGNSRALRGAMHRLAATCAYAPRARLDPPRAPTSAAPADAPDDIPATLAAHGYRVRPAARALGLAPNTVYAAMARLGIPRAGTLGADAIEAARAVVGDDVEAMAAHLRVSAAGLRRRITALEGE